MPFRTEYLHLYPKMDRPTPYDDKPVFLLNHIPMSTSPDQPDINTQSAEGKRTLAAPRLVRPAHLVFRTGSESWDFCRRRCSQRCRKRPEIGDDPRQHTIQQCLGINKAIKIPHRCTKDHRDLVSDTVKQLQENHNYWKSSYIGSSGAVD